MFGYVSASADDLTQEEKKRYSSVYCGICREIHSRCSQSARLSLSYDMAFLALLLTSLYEPEETEGSSACIVHPIKHNPWVDNLYIQYAADMNVALVYYKMLDDWHDDHSLPAKTAAKMLKKYLPRISKDYPRQTKAIADCIRKLSELENSSCANPDLPASCFGQLMGELLCYKEDMWSNALRQMGQSLGRFIYLADAAVDYRQDEKKKKYNPFLAMQTGEDWPRWEQYLVLAMGRCTHYYEKLPLVKDKHLLDTILYSGVWIQLRKKQKDEKEEPECSGGEE